MGRHATVAGRMAASAALKGRVFTKLAREIMVAAKGGSDPNNNSRLRLAVDKAREQNMPKDNIERAIKKGSGELEGQTFEEIVYEGYGPGGTAILVEVLTDNRNRTNPEIKRIFQKGAGNMAEMGSVAWMFKRLGVIDISSDAEDKIMEVALEAGADDVVADASLVTVYMQVAQFAEVKNAILNAGFKIERSGLEYVPSTLLKLSGADAQAALALVDKLEEQDDTQNVFYNFEVE